MNTPEVIAAILGSSVLSSFLTSWFGKTSSDKSIQIENVTKERKEWRDRIRVLVVETASAFHDKKADQLKQIEAELIVRLNPGDQEDVEALECFKKLRINWKDSDLEEFSDRISFLLKHDWERVKRECSTARPFQSLFLMSLTATIFLSTGGWLLTIQNDFLYVGLYVSVFFFALALLKLAMNFYLSNAKGYDKQEFVAYWANISWRKPYKPRKSR